jgi:hypothetical protein
LATGHRISAWIHGMDGMDVWVVAFANALFGAVMDGCTDDWG